MRPLTEEETKTLFLKLSEYIGKSIERLINRSDERHCFRLLKVCSMGTVRHSYAPSTASFLYIILTTSSFLQDRVYYISESLMKASTSIAKDDLLHVGTCFGKFTKSGKFRLHITALDYISQYAKVSAKVVGDIAAVCGFVLLILTCFPPAVQSLGQAIV